MHRRGNSEPFCVSHQSRISEFNPAKLRIRDHSIPRVSSTRNTSLGVRVSGHSAVLHECDISVLLQAEADTCRASVDLVAPRSHKVIIAVEAKYYTTDLALHLGRGFLGLVRDISAQSAFFVINRDAPSIERLLAHKKQHWEHRVIPSETIAVNRLTNAFQKAFQNFRAVMEASSNVWAGAARRLEFNFSFERPWNGPLKFRVRSPM
jgi:hypothetical protein